MPFPRFDDGDVSLSFVDDEDPWILHSYVLALHSPWFKASLSERWNSGKSGSSGSSHRSYQLRFGKDSARGSFMKDRDENTETVHDLDAEAGPDDDPRQDFLRRVRRNTVIAHRMLIALLYHVNYEVNLEWSTFTKSLLQDFAVTADFYACPDIAHTRCDQILRQHFSKVSRNCKEDPLAMLWLGLALKCRWVCRECSIHIVCQNNDEFDEMHRRVGHDFGDTGLASFLAEGRKAFEATLREVEIQLLRLSFERSLEIEDAIAISAFRQWLADGLKDLRGSRLGRNYGCIYYLIEQGNVRRLGLEMNEVFSILIDGQEKYQEAVEDSLEEILRMAQDVITPLLVDDGERQVLRSDTDDIRLRYGGWMEGMALPWAAW